jgi:transposase
MYATRMRKVKTDPRDARALAEACLLGAYRPATLLLELSEECQRVLRVLAQLEMPTLTESQRETVLGELSASVLHLHEHTRGLDSVIDSEN